MDGKKIHVPGSELLHSIELFIMHGWIWNWKVCWTMTLASTRTFLESRARWLRIEECSAIKAFLALFMYLGKWDCLKIACLKHKSGMSCWKSCVIIRNACWLSCQGHMLALLSMLTSNMALWHCHMQCATVTGSTGASSLQPVSIHTFQWWIWQKDLFSFRFLPEEFTRVCADKEGRFKPEASRQPLEPVARPSNWLGLGTHCTNQAQWTIMQLWNRLKDIREATQQPKSNMQCQSPSQI